MRANDINVDLNTKGKQKFACICSFKGSYLAFGISGSYGSDGVIPFHLQTTCLYFFSGVGCFFHTCDFFV